VYRIQEPILWSAYCIRKEELKQSTSEISRKYFKSYPLITECLDESVNEYYLFHGTSKNSLDPISELGFDERLSNVNGMFGPGIYFAENSSKSNQYIACPNCDGGSIPTKTVSCRCEKKDIVYCMILTRVCLGNPYVCCDYTPWKITKDDRMNKDKPNYSPYPPNGCALCSSNPPQKQIEHHSVYGVSEDQDSTSFLRNREFVVYDGRLAYPEFLINYKRI